MQATESSEQDKTETYTKKEPVTSDWFLLFYLFISLRALTPRSATEKTKPIG